MNKRNLIAIILIILIAGVTGYFTYKKSTKIQKKPTESEKTVVELIKQGKKEEILVKQVKGQTPYIYLDDENLLVLKKGDTKKIEQAENEYIVENLSYVLGSTDSSVATIDKNGVITALKNGKTLIYSAATFTDVGGEMFNCQLGEECTQYSVIELYVNDTDVKLKPFGDSTYDGKIMKEIPQQDEYDGTSSYRVMRHFIEFDDCQKSSDWLEEKGVYTFQVKLLTDTTLNPSQIKANVKAVDMDPTVKFVSQDNDGLIYEISIQAKLNFGINISMVEIEHYFADSWQGAIIDFYLPDYSATTVSVLHGGQKC